MRKIIRLSILGAFYSTTLIQVGLCADAARLSLIEIQRPPSALEGVIPKLAPALHAIADSNGLLVGADDAGHFIVSTAEAKLSALRDSSAVRKLTGLLPASWTAVKQLNIIYDPINKPTEEDLTKVGLRLVEDYKKGALMVAAPISGRIDANLISKLKEEAHFIHVSPLTVFRAIPSEVYSIIKPPPQLALTLGAGAPVVPGQPNDIYFPNQWGLRNIHATRAWAKNHDSEVVVAVIDTGVDYTHEDLVENMWKDANGKYGYNFVDKNDDPMDLSGHGTICAGIIGARGDNHIGVTGINWKAKIMAVRWLDAQESGNEVNAAKAIDYAVEHGAKVLNLSWYTPSDSQIVHAAIERASAAGRIVVAAAGNFAMDSGNNGGDNNNPKTFGRYPSSYSVPNLISVAATDNTDKLTSISHFGSDTVDLGAPGIGIRSTFPDNRYAEDDGTSMSAPFVVGAAALLWANDPAADAAKVKLQILNNVRRSDNLTGRCRKGGVLDLSFMGNAANSPAQPAPSP